MGFGPALSRAKGLKSDVRDRERGWQSVGAHGSGEGLPPSAPKASARLAGRAVSKLTWGPARDRSKVPVTFEGQITVFSRKRTRRIEMLEGARGTIRKLPWRYGITRRRPPPCDEGQPIVASSRARPRAGGGAKVGIDAGRAEGRPPGRTARSTSQHERPAKRG